MIDHPSGKTARLARERLIDSFTALAHHVARRYSHWSADPCDFFQVAMLGVIKAVDSYDPASGHTIGQHVGQHVKWELGRELKRIRLLYRDSGDLPIQIADDSAADETLELEHEKLWDAIGELPAADQAILISSYRLFDTPRMSRDQLCRKFCRSTKAITSSKARSKAKLRIALSA
jgi:RNA polymerase sigma factor (sigma-70 family)